MPKKKPIVALIYDFDGTLPPGNMQELGFIQAIGERQGGVLGEEQDTIEKGMKYAVSSRGFSTKSRQT